MRVNPRKESGAVAIVTAICLVVCLGLVALAVDLGGAWANRRNAVTATDAAALAAAQELAAGNAGGCSVAAPTLATNFAGLTGTCSPAGVPGTKGYVTVAAATMVDTPFAPILGQAAQVEVRSSTSAAYGYLSSVNGLRPFAVCQDNPSYLQFVATGSPGPYDLKIGKEHGCISGGGSFGFLDFDDANGNAGNAKLKDWFENGYDGEKSVGDDLASDPGVSGASLKEILDALIASGAEFVFPIVIQTSPGDPSGGTNVTYSVTGFVGVRLIDYKITGTAAQRYLRVEFTKTIASGTCCSATPTGVMGVKICAVDPDATAVAKCAL